MEALDAAQVPTQPSPQDFQRALDDGCTLLPLWAEVRLDMASPLALLMGLGKPGRSFLLESSEVDLASGRYSLVGLDAERCLAHFDGATHWHRAGQGFQGPGAEPLGEQPLQALDGLLRAAPQPDWPFPGGRSPLGLYGYLGYDMVRYMEPCLQGQAPPDVLRVPEMALVEPTELLLFDHHQGRIFAFVQVDAGQGQDYAQGQGRLRDLVARVQAAPDAPPLIPPEEPAADEAFQSVFGKEAYLAAARQVKDRIRDGEAFQVVLAQQMTAPFTGEPLDLYRAIRAVSPSPYMYYFDFGGLQLAGASPETLCRLRGSKARLRPIAGTRRRGRDVREDLALAEELRSDPKERAEHVMLIDLARNDLGRVAKVGTVRLTEEMQVQRLRQVMHLTSTVEAELREGVGAMDLIAASFPAGTLSGAPKVRAMQIIDQLEPVKRGVFGGGVGYLGYDGSMDLAICIRTAVLKDSTAYVAAGGGIVMDAVPELEWKETINKARTVFRAVRRVQGAAQNLGGGGGS